MGYYRAQVAEWINPLGYTKCPKCKQDDDNYTHPMYADNSAIIGDKCDTCGDEIKFNRSTKEYEYCAE